MKAQHQLLLAISFSCCVAQHGGDQIVTELPSFTFNCLSWSCFK